MKAPLAILSLVLVGCVTVQPCVCPTPDVLIPKETAEPLSPWKGPARHSNVIQSDEPWWDGCNWHRPLGNGLEGVTLMGCSYSVPGVGTILPSLPPTPTPTPKTDGGSK